MDLGGFPWFSAFHVFSLFQRKTFKTNPQQILALPGRNFPHQPFFGFQLTGDTENANLSRYRCSLSWGFQISEHILEKKRLLPNDSKCRRSLVCFLGIPCSPCICAPAAPAEKPSLESQRWCRTDHGQKDMRPDDHCSVWNLKRQMFFLL